MELLFLPFWLFEWLRRLALVIATIVWALRNPAQARQRLTSLWRREFAKTTYRARRAVDLLLGTAVLVLVLIPATWILVTVF